MPIELETLNTGTTDSSALMIFMAGKKRYACAKSAFQLRQLSWSFLSRMTWRIPSSRMLQGGCRSISR